MKRRNFIDRADNAAKLILTMRGAILALIAFSGVLALLIAGPFTVTQHAANRSIPKPAPTPPDPKQVLDLEAADDLISEFTDALNDILKEDERKVESITEKWEGKELTGKTRGQAIVFLLPDVKRVIKDEAIQKQIMTKWMAGPDDDEEEVPENPGQPVAQPDAPADENLIVRAAVTGNAPGVLDDARKKSVSGLEMAFFNTSTKNIKFVKEAGNYRGQWYSIFKDPADADINVKIAAVQLAVKTIVDKGLKLPYDLRFYCTANFEAQDRAFARGDKWASTANIVFKWGPTGKQDLGSVSQMDFPGFNRLTITMIHEIGHLLHERSAGDVLFWGRGSSVVDGKPTTGAKVSKYAGGSKKEFVAEVFAGLMVGKKWPADVLTEYNSYMGPKVP